MGAIVEKSVSDIEIPFTSIYMLSIKLVCPDEFPTVTLHPLHNAALLKKALGHSHQMPRPNPRWA